jgi:5-dehydro-2-deoxygluconokinase
MSDAVIVCKRGARGCVVFAGPIPPTFEQALVARGLEVEICNVLGAGDAFLAGFLSGYLRGAAHEESARRGNACGALAVSRLLCSSEFPTRAELDHLLAHGSTQRALRHDPQLGHLHHATTRRPQPATLHALAIAGESQLHALLSGSLEAPADRLERFQQLAEKVLEFCSMHLEAALPGGRHCAVRCGWPEPHIAPARDLSSLRPPIVWRFA